jgi:ABC-type transporter Mla MlaB component
MTIDYQRKNVYQQIKKLTCKEIEALIPSGCRGISRIDTPCLELLQDLPTVEEKSTAFKDK